MITTIQMRAYRKDNQKEYRQHRNVDKHLRIARAIESRINDKVTVNGVDFSFTSTLIDNKRLVANKHFSKAAKLHKKYHGIL